MRTTNNSVLQVYQQHVNGDGSRHTGRKISAQLDNALDGVPPRDRDAYIRNALDGVPERKIAQFLATRS
jgi:DNA-directed RNA polymerase specialized sigma24 family protein